MDQKYVIAFMYLCLIILTEIQHNCLAKENQYIDVEENSFGNMNVNPKKIESHPYKHENLRFGSIDNKWGYPVDASKSYRRFTRITRNLQKRKTYHRVKRPYLPFIRIEALPAYIKLKNRNTNPHNDWKNIGNKHPERYYHRLLETHYVRVMRK